MSEELQLGNFAKTPTGKYCIPVLGARGFMDEAIESRDVELVQKIREHIGVDCRVQLIHEPLSYRFHSIEDAEKFTKSAEAGNVDWSLPILPAIKDEFNSFLKNPVWMDAPFEVVCVLVEVKN